MDSEQMKIVASAAREKLNELHGERKAELDAAVTLTESIARAERWLEEMREKQRRAAVGREMRFQAIDSEVAALTKFIESVEGSNG